jgi:hypothetical protein
VSRGVAWLREVPSPSWLEPLAPQHFTAPAVVTKQVWARDTPFESAAVRPAQVAGPRTTPSAVENPTPTGVAPVSENVGEAANPDVVGEYDWSLRSGSNVAAGYDTVAGWTGVACTTEETNEGDEAYRAYTWKLYKVPLVSPVTEHVVVAASAVVHPVVPSRSTTYPVTGPDGVGDGVQDTSTWALPAVIAEIDGASETPDGVAYSTGDGADSPPGPYAVTCRP